MLKRSSRLISGLLTILLLLSSALALPMHANAAGKAKDTTKPKIINVVYDDSGSMYNNGNMTWSQAKYALEVFTAMMGENDTLHIYNMSDFDTERQGRKERSGVITIKGSQSDRVKKVHDMDTEYWNTPYSAVQAAAEDLAKESKDADRWLVVLTDGSRFTFKDNSAGSTKFEDSADPNRGSDEATTAKYLGQGLNLYAKTFNVAYLGIGSAANTLQAESGSAFYPYKAETSSAILKKVTDIANLIFEHQVMDGEFYTDNGTEYQVNVDIPLSQIIVFAQGENVSLGDLKQGKDKVSGGSSYQVKYSDILPLNWKGIRTENTSVDTSLKGVVATYNAGDDAYPAKTFTVDIQGAKREDVQFYYKPAVSATCIFVNEDGEIFDPKTTEIESGDYTVKLGFIDPATGDEVSSKLLKTEEDASGFTIENNGKEISPDGSGKYKLEDGDLTIEYEIVLKGNLHLQDKITQKVAPGSLSIHAEITKPEEPYQAHKLGDQAAPILVTLIDDKTGKPITQEQWDASKPPKVSGEKGEKNLDWEVTKGSTPGTYEIRPVPKGDKNVSKIESGRYTFTVEGEVKGEKKQQGGNYGPVSDYIEIGAYEGTQVILVQEETPEPTAVLDMKDFPGITIKAYLIDDETGEQTPLPEEAWKELDVKCVEPKTGRISWSAERGSVPGTYIIKPGYPFGLALFMNSGDVETHLKMDKNIGPLHYMNDPNRDTAGMDIIPLTLREIWSLIWKYVVALAIFLFFLIGYLKKPRINRSKFKPNIVRGNTEIFCDYSIRRKWVPYLAERAIVANNQPGMKCAIEDLYIQAVTSASFRILNAQAVLSKPLLIKDELMMPEDWEKLARRNIAYGSFNMKMVPKSGERVGMFHMSTKKK